MAKAYWMFDQKQEAVNSIETALALSDEPEIWYFQRAGQIYEWVGDVGKAIEAYQGMLLIDPQNSEGAEAILRLEAKKEDK